MEVWGVSIPSDELFRDFDLDRLPCGLSSRSNISIDGGLTIEVLGMSLPSDALFRDFDDRLAYEPSRRSNISIEGGLTIEYLGVSPVGGESLIVGACD